MADHEERGRSDRRSDSADEESGRGDQGSRGGGRRSGYDRRDFRRRAKICQFCAEKSRAIDYKDILLLRQFVSERGRIFARRKTGTCARHQRVLAQAIKRARQIALLPYTSGHTRAQGS